MKEKLSALLDGDFDELATRQLLDSVGRDPSLRTDWKAYCLIGDVLRGDSDGSLGFVDRVMGKIESGPTVLAPGAAPLRSAGEGSWRSVMPLAASLMGVIAVGWVAHTLYADPVEASRVTSTTSPAVAVDITADSVQPVSVAVSAVPSDPNREYVFAHQSVTSGGPISGAIQHVRVVSDVRQDIGR